MPTPTNRNYLSGVNYKLNFERCPHVEFFAQSVTTPDHRLGTIDQPTPYNFVKMPGNELYYGQLIMKFIVDEDLKNYNEIVQWIRYLANPSGDNYCNSAYLEKYGDNIDTTDISLLTLNSHFNGNVTMVFRDAYPVYLSGLMLDSSYTNEQFQTAEANFQITWVDMYDREGNKMWLN